MKLSGLVSTLILQPGRSVAVWAASQLYAKSASTLNFCLLNFFHPRAVQPRTRRFTCTSTYSKAMNSSETGDSAVTPTKERVEKSGTSNEIANVTSFGDTKPIQNSVKNIPMSPVSLRKLSNRAKLSPNKPVQIHKSPKSTRDTLASSSNGKTGASKSTLPASSNSARLPPISSPNLARTGKNKNIDAKSTQVNAVTSHNDESIASLTSTFSSLAVNDRRPNVTQQSTSISPSRTKNEKNENEKDGVVVQPGLRSRLASSGVFLFRKKSSVASTAKQSYNSLDDVILGFKSSHFQKVVLIQESRSSLVQGAGISTISGIPDFRTKGTGLYSNLQQYNIPYPEAIFDIDYFRQHPKAFYTLARELYPSGKYKPNIAHYFARLLYEKKILLRVYTQNIDGLERLAGIPANLLVEAHGTFASASCIRCRRSFDNDLMKSAIFSQAIAKCATCKSGLVKPDITFFGEDLPDRFFWYRKDLPQADLVIVMGTSLAVEPFCNIVCATKPNIPRLLINRDKVGIFRSSCKATDISVVGELDASLEDLIRYRNDVLFIRSFK